MLYYHQRVVGVDARPCAFNMAEHKVPQDVEAEDKLLGPFSFRQFAYLMIAVAGGALAFFLGRMNIFLAIVPAPVVLVFLVLALPLRKDQPMETYVAALIHFYLQPARRTWSPDGTELSVEITNPPIDTTPQTKDFGGAEAAQRLSFLAEVADTQGWSTRGVGLPTNTTVLSDDFASDAVNAPDILDEANQIGQVFDYKLVEAEQRRRAAAVARMENLSQPAQQYAYYNSQPAPQTTSQIRQPVQATQSPTPQVTSPISGFSTPQTTTANSNDEASISAALRQSSTSITPTFRQTVVQPIRPTQTITPATTAPPTNLPTAIPTQSSSAPVQNPQPVNRDTIISVSDTISQTAAAPNQPTIDIPMTEISPENSDSNGVEISLH